MSTGRALLGFVGVATIVVAHAGVAILASRRWFSDSRAPLRQLIQAVLALTSLLAVGIALGTLGWFEPLPLVVGSVVVGVAAVALLPRAGAPGTGGPADHGLQEPEPGRPSTPASVGVALAIGLLAVRWTAELIQTVERGFSHADELHYHLTHAALFAQSGRTWPIRFTSVGDGAAYHPAHAELLHGVGLSVFGSDFLSVFVNLVFAAMALAAGWVIGRRAGSAPAGALLVAAVLSLPLVTSESGSALNDTMAIALLLTAVALLLTGPAGVGAPRRYVVVAGLAAGLAVGTKLTVVVAVGALVLVVLARPAADRLRTLVAFVGAALVAGGYWYLRNLAATGNPVPALSFGPLPGPELELQRAVEFPVIDYLADVAVWREYFVPGLDRFFGPLWPLVPGAVVLAAVAALVPRVWRWDRRWSLVAVCGLASLAGYAITPTSAAGRPGEPVLFSFNLRYALPGALLCLLAGLAHPWLRRHPERAVALAGAVFLASNLHGLDPRRGAMGVAVVAAAVCIGLVLGRTPRRVLLPAAALGVIVGIAVGIAVNDRYLEQRWTADLARWGAYEAGDRASGLRVGVTGFPQSYPFFGAGLDNEVVTLGDDSPGDELVPLESCADWWAAVGRADVDVVVVLSEPALAASELGRQVIHDPDRWLRAAGAQPVLDDRDASVFDVRSATPSCDG